MRTTPASSWHRVASMVLAGSMFFVGISLGTTAAAMVGGTDAAPTKQSDEVVVVEEARPLAERKRSAARKERVVVSRPLPTERERREPSKVEVEPARLPYGSLGADPRDWIQNGPDASRAPNATPEVIARFEAASCVGATACSGRRPIAVNDAQKRNDFASGLMDDRVTLLLLRVAERHRIVVGSARSSHSRYVQDRSGRRLDSNHYYGRAADIQAVDGVPCANETAGRAYGGGLDNPPPARPGPCTRLAAEINTSAGRIGPTETIFYFDVGGTSGVSLENHADHVHVGFNSFEQA